MAVLDKVKDAAGWAVGGTLLGAVAGWLLGVNPLLVAASLGATAAIVKGSFGRSDPCPPGQAASVEEMGRNIGAFLRGMGKASDDVGSERYQVWVSAEHRQDRSRLH